ncbi:MAG: ATP-binding cassette subfamily F protein 3 [Polaribacter sp.]|jgi:ATP-binding cassette subfamily F protein 3
MIVATELFIKYGDRTLLNNINFTIQPGDKIGLVGRNGAGKSTILKLIAGIGGTDSGSISRPNTSTLGFLQQHMILPQGKTVMAETLSAFSEVNQLEEEIENLNKELTERTDYETESYMDLITKVSDGNDRFQVLGGLTKEVDTERVLKGLGFKQTDLDSMTSTFSGGWQMRIELAKMLLQRPDYLLLDEPTNHLDIESIIWLEQFLKHYDGAVIVISHDKQFLDTVTKRTMEVELGNMYEYKATYSRYLVLRKERREKMEAAYRNQQSKIAQTEKLIDRFRAKASKAKMAQSLIKQLDKVDRIELEDEDSSAMNIRFMPAPRSGDVIWEVKKLSKSYDTGPKVLDKVDFKIDRGDRVAFVGQNGQGKSTLAKILVDVHKHTEGESIIGHNARIGYYAQNQTDTLDDKMTLLESIESASPPEMRTKLRGILGAFLFRGEDVDKKVSVLSGGEKARLALACMLLRPINLLVLDEPTNHLDITSKEILKQAIKAYDGSVIVVSHDRDFLGDLTNRTIEFRDKKLHEYLGDVNFFLEKRAMNNMREVELKTEKKKIVKEKEKVVLTEEQRKERKRLQNAVANSERKIGALEGKIAKVEEEMGRDGFYESANADERMAAYQKFKDELGEVMEKWEAATEELED